MVGGKPSTGCFTCRQRRIKCDEGKPICTRCIKSKRKCLGYRDSFELNWRDETRSLQRQASGMPGTIRSPVQDMALDRLFRSLAPESGYFVTLPDYLHALPMLYPRCQGPTAFTEATEALALATFSRDEVLLETARVKYSASMAQVNREIQNESFSDDDDLVLMTVLLFGLLEAVVSSPTLLPKRSLHLQAAAILVRARGQANFRDDLSRSLASAVIVQLSGKDLRLFLPPVEATYLVDELRIGADVVHPKLSKPCSAEHGILKHTNDVAALRHDGFKVLEDSSHENTSICSELIQRAVNLDRELSKWPQSMPQVWTPAPAVKSESPGTKDQESPYGSDKYDNLWVLRLWNVYRICRIFALTLHTRLVERLHMLSPDGPNIKIEDYPSSPEKHEVLQNMVDGICRTVRLKKHDVLEVAWNAGICNMHLLWPLQVAQGVPDIDVAQRDWLRFQISSISNALGLNQEVIDRQIYHVIL